jgi:hypothetical protein
MFSVRSNYSNTIRLFATYYSTLLVLDYDFSQDAIIRVKQP